MAEFTITISTPDEDMSTDTLEQILLDALHKQSVLSRDFSADRLSITGVTPESYYERYGWGRGNSIVEPVIAYQEVNDISLVTHIDDDNTKYRYISNNDYEVWMDKAYEPYWRLMPDNTIECASNIHCVSDLNKIRLLEARTIHDFYNFSLMS
jgi:hypothetical protein